MKFLLFDPKDKKFFYGNYFRKKMQTNKSDCISKVLSFDLLVYLFHLLFKIGINLNLNLRISNREPDLILGECSKN